MSIDYKKVISMKKEMNSKDTTDLMVLSEAELKEPSLYQVYIHNDDYTPMEFVIEVLQQIFFMDRRQATDTMYQAHTTGRALCGVFSRDVAETKIEQLKEFARQNEHPLFCSMEAAT